MSSHSSIISIAREEVELTVKTLKNVLHRLLIVFQQIRCMLWAVAQYVPCKKKMQMTIYPAEDWTETLDHVALKARFYCKLVQVCHIPVTCDIFPLIFKSILEFLSPRIMENEPQGVIKHIWVVNVGRQMKQMKRVRLRENPTLLQ